MSDELVFLEEDDEVSPHNELEAPPWKLLVVDDDEDIHQVTKLVLNNFRVDGIKVQLLHAYDSEQAVQQLKQNNDIAVILLDVVMESEHAGLDLISKIRVDMGNHFSRIVLRTGQPGQAPEASVIEQYDINDYKEKTELTTQKLKTLCISLIRSYRDIRLIDQQREGLERLISSLSEVIQSADLKSFASLVLNQVVNLLQLDENALYCRTDELKTEAWAASSHHNRFEVLAASGKHLELLENGVPGDNIPDHVVQAFDKCLEEKESILTDAYYVGYYRTVRGAENLLYVSFRTGLNRLDKKLLNVYSCHVAICFENLLLHKDSRAANQKLLNVIKTLLESSHEISAPTTPMVRTTSLLAQKANLPLELQESLNLLVAFFQIGKLLIPSFMLQANTPEAARRKIQADVGSLTQTESALLNKAVQISWQANEHWDGTGYPEGLKQDEISDQAQLFALTDTFDRIINARTLDSTWNHSRIQTYFNSLKGNKFKPEMVDLINENLKQCEAFYE